MFSPESPSRLLQYTRHLFPSVEYFFLNFGDHVVNFQDTKLVSHFCSFRFLSFLSSFLSMLLAFIFIFISFEVGFYSIALADLEFSM